MLANRLLLVIATLVLLVQGEEVQVPLAAEQQDTGFVRRRSENRHRLNEKGFFFALFYN